MASEAEIATLYSKRYKAGIEVMEQQVESVTSGLFRTETDTKRELFEDQVGLARLQAQEGRAVDIPVNEIKTGRRRLTTKKYYARDFIDESDKLEVLNDPTNQYTEAFIYAARRTEDKVNLDALLGTAYSGKEGTTAVTLPSSQQIAAASAGFTLGKLKSAVQLLKTRNAVGKNGVGIHVFWTAAQEAEFIDTKEVASRDYTRGMVMENGELRQFYGCNFHRIEDVYDEDGNIEERMLPYSGTTRSCIVCTSASLLVGMPIRPTGNVTWLPERDAWQVAGKVKVGAVRRREAGVVQLDVVES